MGAPESSARCLVNQKWLEKGERGNASLVRLMVWIARVAGPRLAGLLLYPICLYFMVFSRDSRVASRDYLMRVSGQSVSWFAVFRHYLAFAATVLHRVYFLAGRYDLFDIRLHGAEVVEEWAAAGRGCLLLGAHLGSFEALRAAGVSRGGLSLKMMMYEDNARYTSVALNALNPEIAASVIRVGTPEALLAVNDHLQAGGLLGLLGDRGVHGDKRVLCQFLGDKAWFPTAPMVLAAVTGAPVVLAFALYRGGRQYDVFFEPLVDKVAANRKDRAEAVRHWTERYAERLAYYCRLAPDNWFNFYDFWDKDEGTSA